MKFPSPQHRLKVIQQQHVALFEDSIGTCLVGIGKRCALHRLGIEVVELATSRIQPVVKFAQRIAAGEMAEEQGDEMIPSAELGGTASGGGNVCQNAPVGDFWAVDQSTAQRSW